MRELAGVSARVADDTNDLGARLVEGGHVLPDRVLSGKELSRKRFGNDDLSRMTGPLIAAEVAALHEWNSERAKIAGVAPAVDSDVRFSQGQRRMLNDNKVVVAGRAIARHSRIDHARCLNAGNSADPVEKGREEV